MNALSFCSICSICTSVLQRHTCHSILLPHCTVQLFGCLDGTQKTGAVPTAKSPRIRGHLQAHHHVVREAAMVDITRRSRPNPFFCKQNGCGPLDQWVELHRSFSSDHARIRPPQPETRTQHRQLRKITVKTSAEECLHDGS